MTVIATKNTMGMVNTTTTNTMAGITNMVIIRIGIKGQTPVLVLVNLDTALIMDIDVWVLICLDWEA